MRIRFIIRYQQDQQDLLYFLMMKYKYKVRYSYPDNEGSWHVGCPALASTDVVQQLAGQAGLAGPVADAVVQPGRWIGNISPS